MYSRLIIIYEIYFQGNQNTYCRRIIFINSLNTAERHVDCGLAPITCTYFTYPTCCVRKYTYTFVYTHIYINVMCA